HYIDRTKEFGSIIYACAAVAFVDRNLGGRWGSRNRQAVNMFVRDVFSMEDEPVWFPKSRCFDWFSGHSWSSGIGEHLYGRHASNIEDDALLLFGIKAWARVTGDELVELQAALALGVLKEA
ncbi:glycoside hydrolase family 81 protein, partial [Tortispora caseinolytica NRRL Y-17796]